MPSPLILDGHFFVVSFHLRCRQTSWLQGIRGPFLVVKPTWKARVVSLSFEAEEDGASKDFRDRQMVFFHELEDFEDMLLSFLAVTGGLQWTAEVHVCCGEDEQLVPKDTRQKVVNPQKGRVLVVVSHRALRSTVVWLNLCSTPEFFTESSAPDEPTARFLLFCIRKKSHRYLRETRNEN